MFESVVFFFGMSANFVKVKILLHLGGISIGRCFCLLLLLFFVCGGGGDYWRDRNASKIDAVVIPPARLLQSSRVVWKSAIVSSIIILQFTFHNSRFVCLWLIVCSTFLLETYCHLLVCFPGRRRVEHFATGAWCLPLHHMCQREGN